MIKLNEKCSSSGFPVFENVHENTIKSTHQRCVPASLWALPGQQRSFSASHTPLHLESAPLWSDWTYTVMVDKIPKETEHLTLQTCEKSIIKREADRASSWLKV